MHPRKPTKEEIRAAAGKHVPDVIAPELDVLFCGINPGLYTAAVGHHFARPGNRFWPSLHAAGITERRLSAFEERELLKYGYGITNFVERATATAETVSKEELLEGRQRLESKVAHYRPKVVAVLGLGAYRTVFKQPKATVGRQSKTLAGSKLWLLPNPSGLNAHYQIDDLACLFRELHLAVRKNS